MAVVVQEGRGRVDRPILKQFARLQRWEQLKLFVFVVPVLAVLAGFFLYPLLLFLSNSLFDPSFTTQHYLRAFTRPVYLRILRITFEMAFLTTLGALLLGYPVAYLLANASKRTQPFLLALVVIPFWTSILVRTYGWMALLGNNGVINRLLLDLNIIASPLPLIFNRTGVMIGMIHVMLPYMVLPVYAVMWGIPNEFMQAAANLGAGPYQSFLRVYLPLSLPGIGAGCLLVFIISLGFFITPALLGGLRDTMIAQIIEQEISEVFNWGFAAALSTILLVVTLVLYLLYSRIMSVERIYEGKGQ
jgi:ABC-type spermidine/putrescine transport system permease subunit I